MIELRRPAGRPPTVDRTAAGPPAGAGRGRPRRPDRALPRQHRLWVADVVTPAAGAASPRRCTAARSGTATSTEPWPLDTYQTVYATEPGSAEMPSAGRPFTAEVITRLVAKGVGITPLLLHTGVASLEAGEEPYPEWFSVPAETAERVNATRRAGGRVIAVGTTVVRALESAVAADGSASPDRGLDRPGRHRRERASASSTACSPDGTSRRRRTSVCSRRSPDAPLLERSYAAASPAGYRWHEFGDVHLILP